ncbi:hypothetical protein GC209_02275 [bacterium]|nr:hypothetical protein [bacterium]
MIVKILSCAALLASVAASDASARGVAQIGGPSNRPPASFKGQQFVDSRGCLFLRAGSGRNVNWVARIDRNRAPICGMLPTGSAAAQAAVQADMAPDPLARPVQAATAPTAAAPVVAGTQGNGSAGIFGQKPSPGPAPTVFTTAATAPARPAQPGPAYQGSFVATGMAGVQCYDSAPRLESVKLSGGMTLVCTRGDGTTQGWRAPLLSAAQQPQVRAQPIPPAPAPLVMAPVPATPVVMAPVVTPVAATVRMAPAPQSVPMARPAQAAPAVVMPKPPKGWMLAWKDDRLNPLRGPRTIEGERQQDQVWQRSTPMVLVTDPLPRQRGIGGILGLRVKVAPSP